MGKRIITDAEVCEAAEAGHTSMSLSPAECIITPRARDRAEELGIVIEECVPSSCGSGSCKTSCSAVPPRPERSVPDMSEVITQVMDSVRDHLPADMDQADVARMVAQTVVAHMGTAMSEATPESEFSTAAPEGVVVASGVKLLEEAAQAAPVAQSAIIVDGVGSPEGSAMAGTYMQWDATSFDRTVDSPEICVVIEGELVLEKGGSRVTAGPGDMLYLARGMQLTCSSTGMVRMACVNLVPAEA